MPRRAAGAVLPALLLLGLAAPATATPAHLCGPECGPLFADYPHNDSCWRGATSSYFSFDVQPHYHIGDSCFGENDPCAPFFFNGTYHVMWQSHTQYIHVPKWNKLPSGQFGDTGISFGHATSRDLAHWKQVSNSVFPDEWFTSVSVYDGSASVIGGMPMIIAAGLTPNTTSVFCHARATPTDLTDPDLINWRWDAEPLYCGNRTNDLTPFDAPTSAWKTSLGQWQYQDGHGNVFVSDDGIAWRGAQPAGGHQYPGGTVCDFFPLPRVCDGCGGGGEPASQLTAGAAMMALSPPSPFQRYNDTDLACGDLKDYRLPKGTSDVAGIANCSATCAAESQCGGFVFVSGAPGTPTPGGPRCAIKGRGGCCPGQLRGGCFSGVKPGECKHPHPHPPGPPAPPGPTPAPPRPPPPFVGPPSHVHRAGTVYSLVHLVSGSAKDEAGTLQTVVDGGATVVSAAGLGMKRKCDHGRFAYPKSFWDPKKQRRIHYGWVQGAGLQGEEDSALPNGLTLKNNHQSLLREITYDPRLGCVIVLLVILLLTSLLNSLLTLSLTLPVCCSLPCSKSRILNYLPVVETALLRKEVLARIEHPTPVPGGAGASGVLKLPTPQNVANQSEVRVAFALPTGGVNVTFGVRVMTAAADMHGNSPGFDFSVAFTPRPAEAKAWTVNVGQASAQLPLLATDKEIEMVLYVDHTVVECYFSGGRVALTEHVPVHLLLPYGNNTKQGIEIFASGPGATVQNATVWRMGEIWDDVATHGRPNHKPL